jgi:hypothetical protein
MKNQITFFLLIMAFSSYSQSINDDKTVTLTVSAQGQTISEAKQNALRDAIEQAFGTFISSNTEILNDELVKDEIVSVSNGNIQDDEVISEVELPNGGYATTLKATVSVTKLTSFVESKGGEVEFKGSLFGANLRQQKLNEDAEHKSIVNLCKVSDEILSKSLDYDLKVNEPILSNNIENSYEVELIVEMTTNENYKLFEEYFLSVIRSLSMTKSEVENYKKLNNFFYKLILTSNPSIMSMRTDRYGAPEEGSETFYFRNIKTAVAIQNLFIKSNKYLHNYLIKSNLDTIAVKLGDDINKNNIYKHNSNTNTWNLNIRKLERDLKNQHLEEKSRNTNIGFPYFNFEKPSFHLVSSSWSIYYTYLTDLKDKSVFFDKNFYFERDGEFYKKNGKPIHYGLTEYPYNDSSIPYTIEHIKYYFKSIAEDHPLIGKLLILGSNQLKYYSRYIAIYSESEIAKITNFSVIQLK